MRLALLVFVPFASLLAQPDGASLLSQSADALNRYRSYEYTMDMTTDMSIAGRPMTTTNSTLVQAVNPGKFRRETKANGMGAAIAISDGQTVWTYSPLFKRFTKMAAGEDASKEVLKSLGMGDLEGESAKMSASAKVVRSEAIPVDGQEHDCWVVESRGDLGIAGAAGRIQDGVFTFWIDKALGMALQTTMSGKIQASPQMAAMDMHMKMAMHSIKFDEPLPDSLFVFTPPADAKESAELVPGMQALVGPKPNPKPGPKTSLDPAANPKPSAAAVPDPPRNGEPQAYVPDLVPTEKQDPVYPEAARSKGLQGMVQVLLTISPDGRVVNAEALSGNEILRPAALDAAIQWKFRPVLRGGQPVYSYTDTTVPFILDPSKDTQLDDLGFDLSEGIAGFERLTELTNRFPRSPEQVLADAEQQSGGGEMERFYALPELAKKSVEAGALDKAASYANELLQLAPDYPKDWNYGNAIYDGNTVLGLVALRQGSVAKARQYLIESAKGPGSPQLDSFGPDLRLARELLQKGERDAVLEYLSLCRSFWKMGGDQLDAMTAAVRNGGTL